MTLIELLSLGEMKSAQWLHERRSTHTLAATPVFVDGPDDISIKGEDILCWDGVHWLVDHVEYDCDVGASYMANRTNVIAYVPMPDEPVEPSWA
jgi:hypothetical protein